MPERDTSCDYLIFQDGKMKAFGTPIYYQEMEDSCEYKLNVVVTKGTLDEGEHFVNVTRPFDIFFDTEQPVMSAFERMWKQ